MPPKKILKLNEFKDVANISVYAKNKDYHKVISKKFFYLKIGLVKD